MTWQQRSFAGRPAGRIAFGTMWLSMDADRPQPADSIALVHSALDHGIRLIDTADAYAVDRRDVGHGERLVAEALRTWNGPSSEVIVATKGGHVRDAAGGWSLNGSPEHLLQACEASCRTLDVSAIELYFLHRPDPATPFVRSVEALGALLDRGLIKHIGLSNVNRRQLEQALEIAPIAAVSNEFSPRYRRDKDVIAACQEHEALFLPWRPLGGINEPDPLLGAFRELAAERELSPQQIALAWLASKGTHVLPIVGARRPASLLDSIRATTVRLGLTEIERLEASNARNVAS